MFSQKFTYIQINNKLEDINNSCIGLLCLHVTILDQYIANIDEYFESLHC